MSYPQEAFQAVALRKGSLIAQRKDVVLENTLLYQLEVLKKTGRFDAFKLQWHSCYSDAPDVWPVPNHLFWDSDVAKWIEGACYFLHQQPHSQVENAIKTLVDMIRSAQQPDGYINIHFTVVEPEKRFTNLRDLHELYNAGHLIEAALAHNFHYGNEDLLEPILKYVALLCRTFGPAEGQIHGYPGHPEIELALLRLYRRTHDKSHLALAQYFIHERGNPTGDNGQHFYVAEAQRRGDDPQRRPAYYPAIECLWYYSAHKPIAEQETIEGHSVRAMYLLTAAADLVFQSSGPEPKLKEAIYRLWDNMVDRKMYLTGGIGAIKQWEGFGIDYFLPQGTDEGGCYAETCAAIGVMMLAERILQYDLDGRFADIMELCLFNAVLTSMSNDGKRFTYVNQLASSDQDLAERKAWFTCACCPPNVLRLLGQIGGYIYSKVQPAKSNQLQVNVHLYTASSVDFDISGTKGTLTQETDWPWDGKVKFKLQCPSQDVIVRLRIPAWAESWTISPSLPTSSTENGYLVLPSAWLATNPEFELDIPFQPRLISPHPYTNQDTLAIARGPLVYCVEDFDNPWDQDHFKSVQLDAMCQIDQKLVVDEDLQEKYVALVVKGGASRWQPTSTAARPGLTAAELQKSQAEAALIDELCFVPYYFRANRGGRGHSRVGLRRWHR